MKPAQLLVHESFRNTTPQERQAAIQQQMDRLLARVQAAVYTAPTTHAEEAAHS